MLTPRQQEERVDGPVRVLLAVASLINISLLFVCFCIYYNVGFMFLFYYICREWCFCIFVWFYLQHSQLFFFFYFMLQERFYRNKMNLNLNYLHNISFYFRLYLFLCLHSDPHSAKQKGNCKYMIFVKKVFFYISPHKCCLVLL